MHKHKVYDFRDEGFHWSDVDSNWELWTMEEYREYLDHHIARNGFKKDFDAMKWADIFIGVQPFGRSTSIEMGWAAGQGKKTILLLSDGEPELMAKIFNIVCCNLTEVLNAIHLFVRKEKAKNELPKVQ